MIDSKVIVSFQSHAHPPIKLIEHCLAFNTLYSRKNYMHCAIIMRAVIDYVPPIFGFKSAKQLISQLSSKRSFKDSMETLDTTVRTCADDALHNAANKTELIKISKETIDVYLPMFFIVLEETARQLNVDDKRDTIIPTVKINEETSHLQAFKKIIEDGENWRSEFIDTKTIWIYQKNELYQIHEQSDYTDFNTSWTQRFPDKFGSGKHSVDLIYNGNFVKRVIFAFWDGGRIAFAIPEIDLSNIDVTSEQKEHIYFWNKSSLNFKLSLLIGRLDGQSVPVIAKRCNIELR